MAPTIGERRIRPSSFADASAQIVARTLWIRVGQCLPTQIDDDRGLSVFGFFREFRETRQDPNAADTAVLGHPSLAQPMETGMNGTTETERQRKDPGGTGTM